MMSNHFRTGDLVIYRKTKHSTHPGPRASNIQPAQNGDTYCYTVDKYWIIRDIREDGMLLAETRRGKQHELRPDDPALKRANWLQRLIYRTRFDELLGHSDEGQLTASNG
jgi:hypothetical protein